MLRSDLRTCSNTTYIVGKAYKRMWIVRRLKALGASTEDLLKVLRAQVLSVLQFAIPVWSTLISTSEAAQIESVLKTGLYLIYGPRYKSFKWGLKEAGMLDMKSQRNKILKKFIYNCLRSDKFSTWFSRTENKTGPQTRSKISRFKPVPVRN
jgi:hypothetical protein